MFQIIGFLIIIYIVAQTVYTSSFFVKGRGLVKKEYTGEKILGDAEKPEFKILIDGDSVGAGVGAASFETSVAGRIALFYAKDHKIIFKNNSISGSTMSDLIDRKIPDTKQDLVVLIVSSNDLFHFKSVSGFEKNTEKALAKYSKITDRLIIVGPGRVFDAQAIPFFVRPIYKNAGSRYSSVLAEKSEKFTNVVYINPFETKLSRDKYGATLSRDGFHPNDSGYEFWFDMIKPFLK